MIIKLKLFFNAKQRNEIKEKVIEKAMSDSN